MILKNVLSKFVVFCIGLSFCLGQTNPAVLKLLKRSDSIYASNPDSSFILAEKAERLALQLNDSVLFAQAVSAKAKYYLLKSDLQKANDQLAIAQYVFLKHGEQKSLAQCYKLRAILSERLGNNQDVLLYSNHAIELYQAIKDTKGESNIQLNISLEYCRQRKFDEAAKSLKRAEELIDKSNERKLYFLYQNKGILNTHTNQYPLAIEHFNLALAIANKYNMIDSRATIYKELCRVNRLSKNYPLAISNIDSSIAISKRNQLDHELIEAYDELILIKKEKGDFQEAFNILSEQNVLKEKILNIEKVKQIAFLERKSALAEKQVEIETQRAENIGAKAKNKILFYVILSVVGILIASIILLMRTRMFHKRMEIQHKLLAQKNNIIEEKQKEILDSIHYAKRIQDSLLANRALVNKFLPENLIMFQPKDIVSGDFYWAAEHNEYFYLAVCDSTGHGVPGAFMSLLNIGFLSEAIKEKDIAEPKDIFNYVRSRLITTIGNDGQKDGMDAIIIRIAKADFGKPEMEIKYAAAYNTPILISDSTILELQKDKMPVGVSDAMLTFNTYTINIKKGDVLYLYTDGYADQFGGNKGKKFKYKPLNELLLANSNKPFDEQLQTLTQNFNTWKGNLEQVDDVCLLGIKI